jgi:DNA-binding beta-propeller fold protein YncE
VLAAAGGASPGLPLRVAARVPLPGPANRFDYASLDPSTGRLWISHMNANELLAFDLRRRKVVLTIRAPGVHGVLAVPALGRVYASATNAHEVLTVDAHTGAVLASAPAGRYPDGLAYDPVERRVFVSDEGGGVETVISARGRRIAAIRLGGQAGNVQYDAASHRILVDVQTRDQIAVIDPRTNTVVRRVPLPGCTHDHGLYVDSARRLAFVACDRNATLLTLDLRSMMVTGIATVGGAPDVLAFDPSLRHLYVAAESGVVAVFAETANGLRKLGQAFLATAAHTVAVDPHTHLVYFPLQDGPEVLVMKPTPTSTSTRSS